MEDELEHQGTDESLEKPSKAKKPGGMLKIIIIVGVMAVAAIIVVIALNKLFLGSSSQVEETTQVAEVKTEIPPSVLKNSAEVLFKDITLTKYNAQGKIKNLVVNATLEATTGLAQTLNTRSGLIIDIIKTQVSNFPFEDMINVITQDTLEIKIKNG